MSSKPTVIKIVNLTSKSIYILRQKHFDIDVPVKQIDIERVKNTMCDIIEPSGQEVFCAMQRYTSDIKPENGVRLLTTAVGGVKNIDKIPEIEGTIYVVPNTVYQSMYQIRKDFYTIDEPIKTTSGTIVACKSLTRSKYTVISKENESIIADIDRVLKFDGLDPAIYEKIAKIRLRLVQITF